MSSRRTILSRPRTRLYDSSYNMGENMYRPALDRLNRKYTGRPLSPPPRQMSVPNDILERHERAFADDDLENCRRRAEKRITGDTFFDSRGARLEARDIMNSFDEETVSKIKSIRANKKVSIIDDVDMESTVNNINGRRFLDRTEKILDAVGIVKEPHVRTIVDDDFSYRTVKDSPARRALGVEDASSIIKRRSLEITHEDDTIGKDLHKWTALKIDRDEKADNAAARAKQTRSRMDQLDEEMEAMAERQATRERKAARLRALITEVAEENDVLPPISLRRALRAREQEDILP